MDPVIKNAEAKMQKAFDVLHDDFGTVRTGKANPALIENVVINAYGGTTPLKVLELATIHAQDPQTIVITPFDQSVIGEIETGINNANLGFNPVVDGQIIRITIPPLTQERREELVKVVHQKAENGRIMIRQVRHEAITESEKKKDEVSEDEIEHEKKQIQKLTDDYMEKIDNLKKEKEEELMRM